jgi:peptidase S46-like protein
VLRRLHILTLCLFCFLIAGARGDEGMWLFNAFPTARVAKKYKFSPSQAWLEHARLSSMRFNNGGSGSFVSANGLAFTNHHVGADCIQNLSRNGKDYIKSGFYAPTRSQEARCPDLELNVLVGIEDVTAKVNANIRPDMSSAQASQAQRAAMATLEKECVKNSGLRCDVVTLYSGGLYHLYKYKKYTDIRLVFAPEFDIAFFGGDPDNFTYPRYDLDITFFRVYENDKPVHLAHFFRWSSTGVKEGDLIFMPGNPGTTGRLKTTAQLDFLREVDYPARLATYKRRIDLLQNFSKESEENARIAKENLFSFQNAWKAYTGFLEGLENKRAMQEKASAEAKLRESGAIKNTGDSDPWSTIAQAMNIYRELYSPLLYVERMRGFAGTLPGYARDLVRLADEKGKPNENRLREYRDSNLPSLEQELFSAAPVYKSLDTALLSDSLSQMRDALGEDNPVVQKALRGRTPEAAAKELIEGSSLDDPKARKQVSEGGLSAIESSKDPLIALMREIDSNARSLRRRYDNDVEAIERREGAMIAKARFAQSGLESYPDATFTPRLSYGAVKGYSENGQSVPFFTDFAGMFEHAAKNANKPPYQLPDRWMQAKSKLKPATPLNFVSTADIIGGNSGSPTLNRKAQVVGIVFDGNIHTLGWNFLYDDSVARAVSVDSRGIMEALSKVYGATALVRELKSGAASR